MVCEPQTSEIASSNFNPSNFQIIKFPKSNNNCLTINILLHLLFTNNNCKFAPLLIIKYCEQEVSGIQRIGFAGNR